MRVLFHVQHLLGIGHLQRALAITQALAGRGADVTLVSGGSPIPALAAAPARLVQLPPIRARDESFALVDAGGRDVDDALRAARRDLVLSAFAEARPDAVIVEGYPFARRAFRFELDPLVGAARAARPRLPLLCSIRDILVARDDPARDRAIVARIREDFDAVLVHADRAFVPLEASFPRAAEIADRLVYTGYVTMAAPGDGEAPERDGQGEVLVSAGGGAVGYRLLTAALAARRSGLLADRPWRLITGMNLGEAEFGALAQTAPTGVLIERHRADFRRLLRRCAVSVSQAGYNTVLDVLAARVPAVLVPFATARETEQSLRAERLAARGVVEQIPAADLTPTALAAAVSRVMARPRAPFLFDTNGAARAAEIVLGMVERGSKAIVSQAKPRRIRE